MRFRRFIAALKKRWHSLLAGLLQGDEIMSVKKNHCHDIGSDSATTKKYILVHAQGQANCIPKKSNATDFYDMQKPSIARPLLTTARKHMLSVTRHGCKWRFVAGHIQRSENVHHSIP